jgi:hypothetical protein
MLQTNKFSSFNSLSASVLAEEGNSYDTNEHYFEKPDSSLSTGEINFGTSNSNNKFKRDSLFDSIPSNKEAIKKKIFKKITQKQTLEK